VSTGADKARLELLQGMIDLLIVHTLAHGHAIRKEIERNADEILEVSGILRPAGQENSV
jgi:hypothetical protein